MERYAGHPYETLVLSGGGQKGFIQLGVLAWLYYHQRVTPDTLTTAMGTSVGAIIAYLLLLGWTPLEIYGLASAEGWIPWNTTSWLECFWKRQGLMDIDEALLPLKKGILDHGQRWDYTFAELHAMGKTLLVVATNVSESCEVVYSAETSPTMVCLDAIGKSCNIPGLFTLNRDTTSHHVMADGGLVNNFPWTYALPYPRPLGIAIYDDVQGPCSRLDDYLYRCVTLMIARATMTAAADAALVMDTIALPIGHAIPLVHGLGTAEKATLFQEGYQWAERIAHGLSL